MLSWLRALLAKPTHPQLIVLSIFFVTVVRFVFELNMRKMEVLPLELMLHALADQFVFYTANFLFFHALLSLLLRPAWPGVGALVCFGLLFGIMPPVAEALVPALGGEGTYYDYMFAWQWFFHDPSFQPLAETLVVWVTIAATAGVVALLSRSLWRTLLAFLLAWASLLWLGVVAPSLLFGEVYAAGGGVTVTGERWKLSLLLLVSAILVFHLQRLRAHLPSLQRLNHALPFFGLALCGAALAGHPLEQALPRALLIGYLCLVLLLQNDFHDAEEDRLAGRAVRSEGYDATMATLLGVLLCVTAIRVAPMTGMCALGMILLGWAYHHPSVRLKRHFCLSYTVEGGWALSAFATGLAGTSALVGAHGLTWPALLVFGGGALLSIPKDWKDIASDRAAGIPTLYVRLSTTEAEARRLHHRVVGAICVGLLGVLALAAVVYGPHPAQLLLALALPPTMLPLLLASDRVTAVELWLVLLGLWLIGAALALTYMAWPSVAG